MTFSPSAITRWLISCAAVLAALVPCRPAEAQSYPPAWNSTAHYAVGDEVQLGGNVYRAIKAITATGISPVTSYADWELNSVRANTTLMIGTGQTFPTLVSAWDYVINSRIADGVYLHLYLSSAKGNLSEAMPATFLLDHAFGARVAILGDSAGNNVLQFNGTNGLLIDTGHSFNTISGITIQDTSTSGSPSGIVVNSNATITSVSNVQISGFPTSVFSEHNGTVNLSATCGLSGVTLNGLYALEGGIINAPGIDMTGSLQGNGLFADESGVIVADYSVIHNFATGALAIRGGVIEMSSSIVVSNGSFGLMSSRGGIIDAGSSLMSANGLNAIAEQGGLVDVSSGIISHSLGDGCLAQERGFIICASTSFTQNVGDDIVANTGGYVQAPGAVYALASADASTGSYITS
jgi:hypothetical protein